MAFPSSTAMGMPQKEDYENRNLSMQTGKERLISDTGE
jgi:hypothetical protein